MKRIGEPRSPRPLRWIVLYAGLLFGSSAQAALQASVDRSEIPVDESVSLKISTSTNSDSLDPKFEAPDFEIVNQFQNSQFSSVFINGKFENKSESSITFILRPLKVGALKIRNIQNHGERAPDLSVQVIQENLYKKPAPGNAPALEGDSRNFFVKAELSKAKVYKGEQIVVSYYLYRRTRATVRDVIQYPSFQGFIREDLEMPILSNRPDFEAVNLGGIPFERALLARYAVYPIKEGKLRIDGFSVRVDYIPRNAAQDDLLEDPFFQFFTQVAPRTGTSKSDPVTIDVAALPEAGKSGLFTGGVGEFEVNTQVDAAQIRANAPMTVRYTVTGKGNTNLVEFPQMSWPKNIKFYQAQGKTRNLGQGKQEKTFEVVVIPLEKGRVELPPVEFEFFNPDTHSYYKRSTQPVPVEVLEGEAAPPANATLTLGDEKKEEPEGAASTSGATYGQLRPQDRRIDKSNRVLGEPLWRLISWVGLAVFLGFVGLVIWDQTRKRSLAQLDLLKRRQSAERLWKNLESELETALNSNSNAQAYPLVLGKTLEAAKDELYKSLDQAYSLSSRAYSARDLAKILTENHGLNPETCHTITRFLEFTEMIRFSSLGPDAPSFETSQLAKDWLSRIREICLGLPRNPLENQA